MRGRAPAFTCVLVAATVSAMSSTAVGAAGRAQSILSRADANRLLDDSWVTDGERGFFVDGAYGGRRPAFSLYETLWRLKLAAQLGRGTDGVEASSIEAWTGAALEGQMAASALPPIAQLHYAVELRRLVRAPLDKRTIARTLESLASDGLYRSSPSSRAPDWGSTSLAVRILRALEAPVPPPVVMRTREALTSQGPVTAAELGRVVALLEVATELGREPTIVALRERTLALTQEAYRLLAPVPPDAVWLSFRASLGDTAAQLGARLPAVPAAACAALVNHEHGVSVPGQAGSDAQASYLAARLGCSVSPPAAPHGRGGWPTREAIGGALPASTAGLHLALTLGRAAEFAPRLSRQIAEVWLPAVAHSRADAGRADAINLRLLGALVGGATMRAVNDAVAIPTATAGTDPLAELSWLAELQASSTSERARVRRQAIVDATAAQTSDHTIAGAAALELASELLQEPKLHQLAVAAARALRVAPTVYRASGDASDPSLSASSLGTWIERPEADAVTMWRRAGLCDAKTCAETARAVRSAEFMPLRMVAILWTAQRRDYGHLFPIAF